MDCTKEDTRCTSTCPRSWSALQWACCPWAGCLRPGSFVWGPARVEKLFWPTSWQNILASPTITQPKKGDPGTWEPTHYQQQQRHRWEFELWECGGNPKFESCWPALMQDSHRVVIIFNAGIPSHLKEIKMWYSCFAQQQFLQNTVAVNYIPQTGLWKG